MVSGLMVFSPILGPAALAHEDHYDFTFTLTSLINQSTMKNELARESTGRWRPRIHDRSSRAAITIQYTRNPIRIRNTPRRAVKVTAPVINGDLLVQVDFFPDGIALTDPAPLYYNANGNLEAAAICVQGFVQSSSKCLCAKMHTVADDGYLSEPWFKWSLNPRDWPESEQSWTLDMKLQHIFKLLLVDR